MIRLLRLLKGACLGAAFTFLSADTYSQFFTPLGNFSSSELEMTRCPFDKEAGAVYLLIEASSSYDDEYRLITQVHIRLKILNDQAVEEGNVSIPFYSKDNFEFIDDIEGLVANPDKNGGTQVTYLDKKAVFEKKTNQYYSEKKIAFPSVKAGSIIDYSYRSVQKHYGGLDNWYFQKEYPVVLNKYHLVILPNFEFAYQVIKSDGMHVDMKQDASEGSITFSMKEIPGLRFEPFMESARDYMQRVEFQLARGARGERYRGSWDDVAREMYADRYFGKQVYDKLSGTESFVKSLDTCTSEFIKMSLVYNYVRAYMGWNGIDSKYSPDGIKKAWDKKTGTSGELNLILLNLLNSAKLDAFPILVSERQHGKVYAANPFADQFNTVYALVNIGNQTYYLDASNKSTYPGIIPFNVLNTTGLIITKKAGKLQDITDSNFIYRDISDIRTTIDENGTAKGAGILRSYQYAKTDRLPGYRENAEKYENGNFKGIPGISLTDFKVTNTDTDSLPLTHQFGFSFPLTSTGEYTFIPINIFTGITTSNPFISDNRFTNINFGYNQVFQSVDQIEIPDQFGIESIPRSIRLSNADQSISFTRSIEKDPQNGKRLVVKLGLTFKRSLFTAEEYPNLKEYYKKLYEALNEQIVLKKKSL